MNWNEQLAASGLTRETISAGLRKKIASHETAEASRAALQARSSGGTLEESEKSSVEESLSAFDTLLAESNEALIASILDFEKNKDIYAANTARLKARSDAKKPAPVVVAPVLLPVAEVVVEPVAVVEVAVEEKASGNNTVWGLVAGGIAIALGFTLFGNR